MEDEMSTFTAQEARNNMETELARQICEERAAKEAEKLRLEDEKVTTYVEPYLDQALRKIQSVSGEGYGSTSMFFRYGEIEISSYVGRVLKGLISRLRALGYIVDSQHDPDAGGANIEIRWQCGEG